jgi:hypothetical protein
MTARTNIDTGTVLVRDSLAVMGTAHFSGRVEIAGAHPAILLGSAGVSINTSDDGAQLKICAKHGAEPMLIVDKTRGLILGRGLSFATHPDVIVREISRDSSFATASHQQIATARATHDYFAQHEPSCTFDTFNASVIRARDDSAPITFQGDVQFNASVHIEGNVAHSFAFFDPQNPNCAIQFATAPSYVIVKDARLFVNMALCANDALIRAITFIADCASVDIPRLEFSTGGTVILSNTRKFIAQCANIRCYDPLDVFFPERIFHVAQITRASSCAISSCGTFAIIGTMEDGARGSAHIIHIAHTLRESSAQPTDDEYIARAISPVSKLIGRGMRIDDAPIGAFVAVSADQSFVVAASITDIFIFSMGGAQFARISMGNDAPIRAILLRGFTLFVATDSAIFAYKCVPGSQYGIWIRAFSCNGYCAPFAVNRAGLIMYAKNIADSRLSRFALSETYATRVADDEYCVNIAHLHCASCVAVNCVGDKCVANIICASCDLNTQIAQSAQTLYVSLGRANVAQISVAPNTQVVSASMSANGSRTIIVGADQSLSLLY